MKKRAVEYFTARRGNCAQAVIAAWNEHHDAELLSVDAFRACGHGKAPDGLCGAIHAALSAAEEHHADELRNSFAARTGGFVSCREIRQARSISCADCVGVAADLLAMTREAKE
jgi:hypothetical protein